MKQYILLRDNKENGPLSFEEMLKLGFKKYDLIWVEGKSAAWRYPGEIEEFKALAPPVEEQPFDRFYKKEAAEVNHNICNTANYNQPAAPVTAARPKPRIRIKAEWNEIKPATATVAEAVAVPRLQPVTTPAPAPKQVNVAAGVNQPSWESSWLNWNEEQSAVKQASQKNTVNSAINKSLAKPAETIELPALETKFSQSLNEIKEKYAATVLKAKNKAVDLHKFKGMATMAMLAIPVMCFGVWLGHKWTAKEDAGKVIYAKTTPESSAPAANQQAASPVSNGDNTPGQPAQKNNNSKEMIPGFDDNKASDEESMPEKPAVKQQPQHLVAKQAAATNPLAKQVLAPQKAQLAVVKKQNNTAPAYSTPPAAPQQPYVFAQPDRSNPAARVKTINNAVLNTPAVNQPVTRQANVQQAKKADNSDEDNRPVYQHTPKSEDIDEYVTIDADKPYAQAVQGVKLSVQNVADIPLDLVVIDVEYFDAANRFKNGQTIRIKDIPAGETLNVKVPDNLNATKIRYKVSLVSAEKKGVYLIGE